MPALAKEDWRHETRGRGGATVPPGMDRAGIAAALTQAATDATDAGAEVRPALLHRAWTLGETLPDPINFLVVGPSAEARDAMRFLAGLAAPIPDDLASVVACIRIAHGEKAMLMATSGTGTDMRVPDEPIMLMPYAPVTLTYRAPAKALQSFQLTHLRNLAAGVEDETVDTQLPRADRLIWATDAAAPWNVKEETLFHALPQHLTQDAVLLLTAADKVTAASDLQAQFDSKVRLLAQRFGALVPIALPHALRATPGGALTDAALFSASGGHAFLTALRRAQVRGRTEKDAEAVQLLAELRRALDAARKAAAAARHAEEAARAERTAAEARAEAAAREKAEAEARAEAAARAKAEAEARARAGTQAREVAKVDASPEPAAPALTFPRPDETALAILREEAEREAAARRQDIASAFDAPPAPEPEGADREDANTIPGFLKSCARQHGDSAFDPDNDACRRQAFDGFLHLVSGLSQRLRDAGDEDVRDRDRLLADLEEAEDTIMMLSFEGDTDALDEASDLIAQLICDLFDRLEVILSG